MTRKTTFEDTQSIKAVLDSSELFHSEYLDEMIADFLYQDNSEDLWFSFFEEGKLVGFAYCAPEKLTEGTYNLYAIAFYKNLQGKGFGTKLIRHIEQFLKEKNNRLLIIDTSSGEDFKLTRKFYEKLGYKKEAIIEDFWAENEDKITFTKKL